MNSIDSNQTLHDHQTNLVNRNEKWSHAGSSQFCPLSNDLGPDRLNVSRVWHGSKLFACIKSPPARASINQCKSAYNVDASYASSLPTWWRYDVNYTQDIITCYLHGESRTVDLQSNTLPTEPLRFYKDALVPYTCMPERNRLNTFQRESIFKMSLEARLWNQVLYHDTLTCAILRK